MTGRSEKVAWFEIDASLEAAPKPENEDAAKRGTKDEEHQGPSPAFSRRRPLRSRGRIRTKQDGQFDPRSNPSMPGWLVGTRWQGHGHPIFACGSTDYRLESTPSRGRGPDNPAQHEQKGCAGRPGRARLYVVP
ncbi:MAG: hypothetical protein BGO90_01715 [Legionella sp. 40-6]|nr:MAG: hypothetical protein BGO90_01715 [Legionella sp. 40-6]